MMSNAASMYDDDRQLPTGSYAISLAHLSPEAGVLLLFNLYPASLQSRSGTAIPLLENTPKVLVVGFV